MKKEKDNSRLNPLGKSDDVMSILWIAFIGIAAGLIVYLIYMVISYRNDSPLAAYLRPQEKSAVLIPKRGDILDCKGRILATSEVVYEVRLDTKAPSDTVWENGVVKLGARLSELFGDKSADSYTKMLKTARRKGNRYLLVQKNISQIEIAKVRKMPIFCKGRNRGGYIEIRGERRKYPYGSYARRTIGYVKSNSDSTAKMIGIEGRFNERLHGKDGQQLLRWSDYGFIPVTDKDNRDAIDGMDVTTTIDIDIQNIADEALRKVVESAELIEKSCVIVMETKTGDIKAMVNLGRNSDGEVGEWDNYALRTAEAPGSVFKGIVVTALLEDGYITSVKNEVPTYGGIWEYNNQVYNDTKHLGYERFPSGRVKIWQAFEISANNTFRQLVCDPTHYGNNPARFVERVKSLGVIDTIDFDLKGTTPPFILDPSMKRPTAKGFWDGGTFPRMAIGYGMELSALSIVNFYNAIANDGVMMKPRLIAGKPVVMRERICNQHTVDELKKAMGMVAMDENGTAYRQLSGAVCPIAGKTGTAQRVFKMRNGRYGFNDGGVESQQGTFVGFFPKDNPEFTAIVVVWSKPSSKNFFGASYSAPVFREIADKIYCLNEL